MWIVKWTSDNLDFCATESEGLLDDMLTNLHFIWFVLSFFFLLFVAVITSTNRDGSNNGALIPNMLFCTVYTAIVFDGYDDLKFTTNDNYNLRVGASLALLISGSIMKEGYGGYLFAFNYAISSLSLIPNAAIHCLNKIVRKAWDLPHMIPTVLIPYFPSFAQMISIITAVSFGQRVFHLLLAMYLDDTSRNLICCGLFAIVLFGAYGFPVLLLMLLRALIRLGCVDEVQEQPEPPVIEQ